MAEPPRIPDLFSLVGRSALVTGAGSESGIGFATAQVLRSLGADVVITSTTPRIMDRAAELLSIRTGGRVSAFVADLTIEREVADLMAHVIATVGRLDIVVNNAGMVSVDSNFEAGEWGSLPTETWRAGMARNLDTAFLVCRAAIALLPAGGRIVNISSVTGPVMAMRSEPVYAAAKAGMVGMTRSLAVDLGPRGITANAVAPGWIATGSQTDDERRQALTTPLGRSATPEEVGATVAWLCTPGAAYVTGQCLVVDGGNSVAEERG